ncbi:Tat pathway signal protein [bacterium]|nr:MAG: Tat pathway signal protein [bacterium]
MDKRSFLKLLGAGALGLAAGRLLPSSQPLFAGTPPPKRKYWAWVTKDFNPTSDGWKRQLALMRESGIDAILPEIYESRHAFYGSKHLPVTEARLEKILPLAKAEGMEVHAWMWSMPCNVEEVVRDHPEWYVVNRKGESAAEKPAYVPYYKFLCPSQPGAQEFVRTTVKELSQYDELTGVHFDYIRFPDVILPTGLQPKYGITQDREYPEYDYCYCDVCRHDFEQETGTDPLKLSDPAANDAWKQFRYKRISRLVNDILIPVVHEHKKMASAAVFPNWENVRQQWSTWHLDAALPMLYHGFYDKGIDWIGEQTKKEVEEMKNGAPIYSGLFVPQLRPEEMPQAIDTALKAGASGVVLFAGPLMTEEHWRAFAQAVKR